MVVEDSSVVILSRVAECHRLWLTEAKTIVLSRPKIAGIAASRTPLKEVLAETARCRTAMLKAAGHKVVAKEEWHTRAVTIAEARKDAVPLARKTQEGHVLRWLTAAKAAADILHAVSRSGEAVEMPVLDLADQKEEWHSADLRVLTALNVVSRDVINAGVQARMLTVVQMVIEVLRWQTADLVRNFEEAWNVVLKEEALRDIDRKDRGPAT